MQSPGICPLWWIIILISYKQIRLHYYMRNILSYAIWFHKISYPKSLCKMQNLKDSAIDIFQNRGLPYTIFFSHMSLKAIRNYTKLVRKQVQSAKIAHVT